jgi:secreted trypsin-like serine protease
VFLDKRSNRSLEANQKIRPACLWQTEEIEQTTTVATGWGSTEYGASEASDDLMKVKLDILELEKCSFYKDIESGIVIDNKQICVGVLSGGKDTCNGGRDKIEASDRLTTSLIVSFQIQGRQFKSS